jgi:hypothetical protein
MAERVALVQVARRSGDAVWHSPSFRFTKRDSRDMESETAAMMWVRSFESVCAPAQ